MNMKKPIQGMSVNTGDWPDPDPMALEKSEQLLDLIVREIKANHGQMSFERFMEMALYEPGLGYYSAGASKFGREGDFITAPETSPLFSACVARQCEQVFELTGSGTILELGAGSGAMASDIISDLKRRANLPDEYLILEISAELRHRQQKQLKQDHPDYVKNIRWLDSLPGSTMNGIVLANEVLDAIPVNRIKFSKDGVEELMVGHADNEFTWQAAPANDHLKDAVRLRISGTAENLGDDYVTEINCLMPAYLRSLSELVSTGMILLIDYGYPRYEYYHPQRTMGTLVCHYRHRGHDNPFIYVGNQDISAFVDFTTVAECGHEVGLDVTGYTTQAAFLLSMGLEAVMMEYRVDANDLLLSQQAGQLLLPGQMGEKFKLMALTRGINDPLTGFELGNYVHRL
jgi:SAM-dependent MidA family methyltransferase